LVREQFPFEIMERVEELLAEYQAAKNPVLAERLAEKIAIALSPKLQLFIRLRCPEEQAEDILQETLVAISRGMDEVEVGHFKAWCYAIASHKRANFFKRESKRPLEFLPPDELEEILHREAEDDPLEADEEQDLDYALKLLAEVSADCVECVSLHFLARLTYREIAQIWNSTEGAVGIKVRRCCEAARAAHERKHSCV
jgi:RNA polymerase sigma factor (sigma-70 family)